ncbi:MAG: transcriptional repressor NrdR [Armatimonadetes bacterium]|nr:transcriptional repressor NrdR [Armatimonadota bacterium]
MLCPYCRHSEQRVLDSRPSRDGSTIRRRRECCSCLRRFTTFEGLERQRLFVVKRGGSREEFNREKVFESMRVACRKRPVSVEVLREAASKVERDLFQEHDEEVASKQIGEKVMDELKAIDTVAYVRFASVYREFETVSDFTDIIEAMKRNRDLIRNSN